MQRNKFLGVALAAGLAVTAVSACGGGSSGLSLGGTKTSTTVSSTGGSGGSGSSDASGSVTSAFKQVANNAGLQLVLSLSGSPSAFTSSSGVTPAQASAILGSQLIIATHTANGQSLTQSAGSGNSGDFQIALEGGGANLGTIEILGKTLYARVDINKTASTYGLTTGKAEQDQQALQQASSAVPGLSALGAGQWVSVDLTPLLQLEQQSAASSTTTAGAAPTAASEAALVQAFLQALEQNSTITKLGAADGGTEYQAVVREKALVTALQQAAQTVPGLSAEANKMGAANIPATQTLTVDVVLKGGTVSELKLPLNQFDTTHQLGGPLTLNLGISGSPAISAPQGATTIDLSQILSQLGSLSGGTGSAG